MFEWIVAYKLKRIAARAAPDKEFVRELEYRLTGRRVALSHRVKLVAGSLSGLLLAFGGTGAYAYASDNVLPGNALYPVRTTIERAEESLTISPSHRAAVLVRHVVRREREREIMDQRQLPANAEHERAFVAEVESALSESEHVSPEERKGIDSIVASAEGRYASSLERTKRSANESDEGKRAENLLTDQTQKLRARVLTLDASRREEYTQLFERRLTTINELKKSGSFTKEELAVLDTLEQEYADTEATFEQSVREETKLDAVAEDPAESGDAPDNGEDSALIRETE